MERVTKDKYDCRISEISGICKVLTDYNEVQMSALFNTSLKLRKNEILGGNMEIYEYYTAECLRMKLNGEKKYEFK